MFNAAGLIVPDPSIMLPPIPFVDDDTGSGAEYMVASLAEALLVATLVAPTEPVRQSARRVDGGEVVKQQGDGLLMTSSGAGLSHAGSDRAQKKA